MIYLLKLFERLELWVREECEDYDPWVVGKLAVVFVNLPSLVFFAIVTSVWLNRTVHHWSLSIGLWVMDCFLWIVGFVIGDWVTVDTRCGGRVRLEPSQGSAIIWYVVVYELVATLKQLPVTPHERILVALQLTIGMVMAMASCASFYYLGLFNWFEIVIGVLCGVVGAAVWSAIAFIAWKRPIVREKVGSWLKVKGSSL